MAFFDKVPTDIMILVQHWLAKTQQTVLQGPELQNIYKCCQKKLLITSLGYNALYKNIGAFEQVRNLKLSQQPN